MCMYFSISSIFIKGMYLNLVISGLPGVYWCYNGVILVWVLIMCVGENIRQSFKGYLQTFEA